jgi:hypothetical protein
VRSREARPSTVFCSCPRSHCFILISIAGAPLQ